MKIVSLKAQDVLRLVAVEITPAGDLVVIGGDNAQGKTSVLDTIQMGLAGKKYTPKEPIHQGSARAEIAIDLGEITVERIITASSDRLTVRSADGVVQPRPQELLNKLFNSISFDPLSFATEDEDKQMQTLRRLAGLDFTVLDADRKSLFDQRTEIGRDLRRAEARASGLPPHHPEAPAEPVSVAALAALLKTRQEQARQADRLKRGVREAITKVETLMAQAADQGHRIADLERELEAARAKHRSLGEQVEAAKDAGRAAKKTSDAFVVESPAEIEQQLASAEELNRGVRENAERAAAEAEAAAHAETVAQLTAQLDEIDRTKLTMLEGAEFPVEGLGLRADGVFYKGVPFAQASKAEKVRVSLNIGIALNPELRVLLVRDGSVLDRKGLALLAELARERDCQIWLEDARTLDPTAVIIEDGRVVGAEPTNYAERESRDADEEPTGLTLLEGGAP